MQRVTIKEWATQQRITKSKARAELDRMVRDGLATRAQEVVEPSKQSATGSLRFTKFRTKQNVYTIGGVE